MAAPTPTPRQVPSGIIVPEGFKCLITLGRKPNMAFWEKSIKPTGIDGGDKIKITTQHNNKTHTFAPRTIYTPTDGTIKVAMDAKTKEQIRTIAINAEDTITETWPDGSTYCYYGYVKAYELSDFQEGEFPEGTLTIVQTNYDYINHVEAEAVFTEVTGT